MNAEDARAFARSLAHRESAEEAAQALVSDDLVRLDYHADLDWPWPRPFRYRLEYVAVAPASAVLEVIDPGCELVVSLFAPDLEAQEAILQQAGLTRAWLSPIMGRDLSQAWSRSPPAPVEIREVVSGDDRRRFNSLPGISNASESIDDHIHYFYIERDGQVVAKAQLICLGDGSAYISDLFTEAAHRGQGLATAMMLALEEKARALGAQRAILAPGLEQIQINLYERYGYAYTAIRSVLIPSQPGGIRS